MRDINFFLNCGLTLQKVFVSKYCIYNLIKICLFISKIRKHQRANINLHPFRITPAMYYNVLTCTGLHIF